MIKESKKKEKIALRVVDLFSGCGGLSLGLAEAGFDVVAAYDNWIPAVKTYKSNFIHPIFDIDLASAASASAHILKFSPDIIVGGPPCQDFSNAGKRNEAGGRAELTVAFAKIISIVKPRWFLMENVDQITKSKSLKKAKAIFKKAGYGLSEKVLDASFCGVPQKRKRFFMFGELNGEDGPLENFLEKNKSTEPMTMREYFGKELNIEHYYRHPRNYNRRAIFSMDEPSPTIRGVNRPIPKGYKGHPIDSSKDFKNIRPLTTVERSRVQTFPKNFLFNGPKTEVEQLIGNAVPVKLAKYVGESIREYLNSQGEVSLEFISRVASPKVTLF